MNIVSIKTTCNQLGVIECTATTGTKTATMTCIPITEKGTSTDYVYHTYTITTSTGTRKAVNQYHDLEDPLENIMFKHITQIHQINYKEAEAEA